MVIRDKCFKIALLFEALSGHLGAFKALCNRFVEKITVAPKCLCYGYSFDGSLAHSREGCRGVVRLPEFLEAAGSLLTKVLNIGNLARMEIHGRKKSWQSSVNPLLI